MKKNKKQLKLSLITTFSLVGMLTPTIGLVSCSSNPKTIAENNYSKPVAGQPNKPSKPHKKPNKMQSDSKLIDNNQLIEIKKTIDSYFENITENILYHQNFSDAYFPWINELQNKLNEILNPNRIYIAENNYLSVWNSPDSVHFDANGYQTFPIAIWLWPNSKKCPTYAVSNDANITIETKQEDQKDNYYLICNVTTKYTEKVPEVKPPVVVPPDDDDKPIVKPQPKPAEITNLQIGQIVTTLNKYFQNVNTDVTADNINQVLNNKQKQDLRNEINNIFGNSGIKLANEDNYLVMWDGNRSKTYNKQDYLEFLVGIKLNSLQVSPKYDQDQGLKIEKVNKTTYYAVSKVITSYQKVINFDTSLLEQFQYALATNINWKIENVDQFNASKNIIIQQINQMVDQFDIYVQSVDYQIVSQSPITLQATINFNKKFNLVPNNNQYFEQTSPTSIKSKSTFLTNYFEFSNNISQYLEQIKIPNWTNFKKSQFVNHDIPYAHFSIADPYDEVFKPLFEYDADVLKTDVLVWLKSIVDNSDWHLKYNVKKFKVGYHSNWCPIVSIEIEIYNDSFNNAELKILAPNNETHTVVLKGQEKTKLTLNIDDWLVKKFVYDDSKAFTDVLIGYYYKNVNINIMNHPTLNYPQFYFTDYSYGMRRRIQNFDNRKGYFDIEQQGSNYLNNLTFFKMQQDIRYRFYDFNTRFADLLGSFQEILNSIAIKQKVPNNSNGNDKTPRDVTNRDFFTDNAYNFETLIESYAHLYNQDLIGLGRLVKLCFDGSTLPQVLCDGETRAYLQNIFKDYPNVLKIIDLFYYVFFTRDETFSYNYDYLVSYLTGETKFKMILPDNYVQFFKSIKNILLKLKTTPLVDIIILDTSNLITAINQHFFNNSIVGQALAYFALAISYRGLNGSISDSLYAMIRDKKEFSNGRTMSLIQGLLNGFNLDDPNTMDFIDGWFVDNPHFSKENFKEFIKTFSCWNEKRDFKSAYNYANYFTNQIGKDLDVRGSYNSTTHEANIDIIMTYTLKKDIYFNFRNGLNPLVDNMSPFVKKVWSFLPWALYFPKDAVFKKTIKLRGNVDYVVVKNNRQEDKLSWQVLDATTVYDFNTKKTISDFYNRANVIVKGFIAFAMRCFTYAYQYSKNRYVAYYVDEEHASPHETVRNYSNTIPQGDCVIVNHVPAGVMNNIRNDFMGRLKNVSSKTEKFNLGTYTVHKMNIVNDYNPADTLYKLFNFDNVSTNNSFKYAYTCDSQIFVDQDFLNKNVFAGKGKIQLRFKSLVYFYDQKTKKYVVSDSWSFNFFKLNIK